MGLKNLKVCIAVGDGITTLIGIGGNQATFNTHNTMDTYYEITAKIEGKDEILFGSFEKSDCTYEVQNEREGWKAEGFKSIKIVSRKTEEEPDTEVYGLESALLINGLKWEETKEDCVYYCPEKDRFAFIVFDEICTCGTLEDCLEAVAYYE